VIAKAAQEAGILTVGVVTRPFHFEGSRRMQVAEEGIEVMRKCVDTLLVIPNQNLFRLVTEQTTFEDAFAMADDVLYSGVRTFTDLMIKHGLINLDFADICAVMREMKGKAMMGTGQAGGERRAIDAAEQAISCPLLDSDITMKGARAVLINITGGPDMTLIEVEEAANRVREEVDPNANIIFGATFDKGLDGELRVAVVATGIDAQEERSDDGMTSSRSASRRKEPEVSEEFVRETSHFSETIESSKLGRTHDLFADMGLSSETAEDGSAGLDKEASLWADFEEKDSSEPEDKVAPEPVKKRSFSLLERLGMRRAAPPPAEELPADAGDDKPQEPTAEMSEEDIPAFMRQKRRG
jgi:cell division protein FtsZ